MSSDVGLKMLVNDRAAFRAVLEGAGYNNLDALGGMSTDTCRMIGEDAKAATLKLIEQRDELLSIAMQWAALEGQWHPDRYENQKALLLRQTQTAIMRST